MKYTENIPEKQQKEKPVINIAPKLRKLAEGMQAQVALLVINN